MLHGSGIGDAVTSLIPRPVQLLSSLESDRDPHVRASAATALGELELDRFVMAAARLALRRAREDEDARVRAAAAAAVQKIEALWGRCATIRERVLERFSAGRALDAGDVELLVEALSDDDPRVRKAAAAALKRSHRRSLSAYTHAERIIESLADRLRDEDAGVRQEAADALCNIGYRLREMQDHVARERYLWARVYPFVWVVDTFGRVAVPSLEMATGDPDAAVRASVADALAGRPNATPDRRQLVPALLRALEDNDVSIRYEAVQALSDVSPRCEPEERVQIARALKGALEDRNDDVRTLAVDALKKHFGI